MTFRLPKSISKRYHSAPSSVIKIPNAFKGVILVPNLCRAREGEGARERETEYERDWASALSVSEQENKKGEEEERRGTKR